MVMERINAILQSCATDSPLITPTVLYNEGWLLLLVLDWFSTHRMPDHPLTSSDNARWFSEALLSSAFFARFQGDSLAESWTHADGAIGHFKIGTRGKADLCLLPDARHFVVLEAKIFGKLSSGVKNARYFDQAARTVACIAEVLRLAGRHPSGLSHLGFYVLAPECQITQGTFAKEMKLDSIHQKVERRVKEYGKVKDAWHAEWFQPTIERIEVHTISWEEVIKTIAKHDSTAAESIEEFYRQCLRFNQPLNTASL